MVAPSGVVIAVADGLIDGRNAAQRDWFEPGLRSLHVGDVREAKLLAELSLDRGDPWRFIDIAYPLLQVNGKPVRVLAAHMAWHWPSRFGRQG